MPRATKEQSEATARAVLATAREMFAERGYAAVGLEEVAAAAGVTRGAVYHHYSSKLGLFTAVHEEVQRSVAAVIEAETEWLTDPWDQLEAGCHAFLAASVADDACRIMLVDGPAVLGWPGWAEADARNSARQLDEVLAELAAAGVVDAPSVPAVAALLSGAMNAAAIRIAGLGDRAARTAAVEDTWSALRPMLLTLRA